MPTKGKNAAAELERAEEEARRVLERVRAGDPKAGPRDLEDAERRVRFARARLEGEEARAAEDTEERRRARLGISRSAPAPTWTPPPSGNCARGPSTPWTATRGVRGPQRRA